MKFTDEDKGDFRDLISTDGYKVVLKILQTLVKDQEQSVLRYNFASGSQEEKDQLAKLKCELDGARKLYRELRTYENRLKNEPDGRVTGQTAEAV